MCLWQMEVEHIKKSLMKWSSRLSRHARGQHLNTYTVGPRTLWAKTNFVPNDRHDGHQHRGISLLSLTPPYPVFTSFQQCVSVQFTAVCVEIWPCHWYWMEPRPLQKPHRYFQSVQERRTLDGSCLWRALHCSVSYLWPLLLILCVNAFSFCYPYRDSSDEPSN